MTSYKPTPPVPPRALDAEGIAAVHSMVALGVTQRKIAEHLGVHWRTVHNVVNRKAAYADGGNAVMTGPQAPSP